MFALFSYFSTSFVIAIVAWPFVSALVTLPVLAGMYHRYHQLRFTAVLAAYTAILYVLGLVAFTLYPMPDNPDAFCATTHLTPQLNILRFVTDLRVDGMSALLQLTMNIVLFVPLGFVLTRWLRWKLWAVVPAGFLISLLIECSQLTGFWHLYPCTYRQFDVDDLLTNTLGALLGYALARIFNRISPIEQINIAGVNTQPKLLHRAVTLAIDMMFVIATYFPISAAIIVALHAWATPLSNGDFKLMGITFGTGLFDSIVRVVSLLAFLVLEVWIPAAGHGQTLGARFTRMSVETKRRSGRSRVAFYALRTIVLFALLQPGNNGDSNSIEALTFIALVVFWIIKRQMPYDLIPGNAVQAAE